MATNGSSKNLGAKAAGSGNASLILALAALTAVAPLAIDMYIPGFPAIVSDLTTGDSAVQLSLTAFLVGLAAGQLLFGPLSDALGRRGLLLVGCAGFAAFSFVGALTPSIEFLVVARLLQGLCGAAGVVIARAVITDRFSAEEAPRYFAILSVIIQVAPVVAPALGGAIVGVASWRWVFVVLAVFGAGLLAATLRWVPESLPPERRNRGGVGESVRALGWLLLDRAFLGQLLVLSLAAAGLFAYVSGSSFVFVDVYGLSPTVYGLIFASNSVAIMITSLLFGALARRVPVRVLLGIGIATSGLASLALLTIELTTGGTAATAWACLFVAMAGMGFVAPASMTLGQYIGAAHPGSASALLGAGLFLFGGIASPLVGALGAASAIPMAAIMTVSYGAAAISLFFLGRSPADGDTTDGDTA